MNGETKKMKTRAQLKLVEFYEFLVQMAQSVFPKMDYVTEYTIASTEAMKVPLYNMLIVRKLTKLVNAPARGNNLLDLIITNVPQNVIGTIVPDFLLVDQKLPSVLRASKNQGLKPL